MSQAAHALTTTPPSRRAFLSAGTAAVATSGFSATAAWAQDSADDALEPLWERWRALYINGLRISRAYNEASDRLPWWAAPGPTHVPDIGGTSGWPAIQGVEPHEHPGIRTLIRPGLADLKKNYQHETMFGEERARNLYRKRVRALAKRRYAQKIEHRKVGLPAIEKASDVNCAACLAVADAIEALPIGSFPMAAARLLIDFAYESVTDDTLAEFDSGRLVMILTALRPHLRGTLARDVDALLADPNRPPRETWIRREGEA